MRLSLLFLLLAALSLVAYAQPPFKVLHAFGLGKDAGGLWSSVVFDQQGNIYGSSTGGGAYNGGTVFQLSPGQNGQWSEAVLYSFPSFPEDGDGPWGGPAVDASGNVYGTTQEGGLYHRGIAFELSSGPDGWSETVLHNFAGPGDPTCCVWGNLTLDQYGNVYGTGYSAFELSPGPSGWSESILHTFADKNGDGDFPQAGPILDDSGNIYGATTYGGGEPTCPANTCGTVYELQPVGGAWKEHILHRFGSFAGDGEVLSSGEVAMDSKGNLYGSTVQGGANLCVDVGCGTIFKLAPVAASTGTVWIETILYNFVGGAAGLTPGGSVIVDGAGNLYGTTISGGSPECQCGVVYELSPKNGGWKYTILHTFTGSDGAQPDANMTFGPDGNLYGTTATGGTYGAGVVFEIQIAQ